MGDWTLLSSGHLIGVANGRWQGALYFCFMLLHSIGVLGSLFFLAWSFGLKLLFPTVISCWHGTLFWGGSTAGGKFGWAEEKRERQAGTEWVSESRDGYNYILERHKVGTESQFVV